MHISLKPIQIDLMWLKAVHYGDYNDGIVAGAYCGEGRVGGEYKTFFGLGGIKNTETLYAYGMSHFINLRELEEDGNPLQVFLPNKGVKRYLEEFVPKWIANGGYNSEGRVPDAYEAWKDVHMLTKLSKISVDRPQGHYKSMFTRISGICREKAALAHSLKAYRQNSLLEKGEL